LGSQRVTDWCSRSHGWCALGPQSSPTHLPVIRAG
jgi:hypothetical protein